MSDTRALATWAASSQACYAYPGEGEQALREAFCQGSGWAAAEIERLRKGIQDYLDGDYEPRVKKNGKCHHGTYGYETCGACTDEHFEKLLVNQQSGDGK